jgi:hypothetical protein
MNLSTMHDPCSKKNPHVWSLSLIWANKEKSHNLIYLPTSMSILYLGGFCSQSVSISSQPPKTNKPNKKSPSQVELCHQLKFQTIFRNSLNLPISHFWSQLPKIPRGQNRVMSCDLHRVSLIMIKIWGWRCASVKSLERAWKRIFG